MNSRIPEIFNFRNTCLECIVHAKLRALFV